jgi:hypothetical protein
MGQRPDRLVRFMFHRQCGGLLGLILLSSSCCEEPDSVLRRQPDQRGIADIDIAAKAASALRPLAGSFAYLLFALGILGVGLIGVPVLAGSGAYALSEAMGCNCGLERKPVDARGFYTVIAVSVLAGLGIQYSPISPMKALFWSAVILALGVLMFFPNGATGLMDRPSSDRLARKGVAGRSRSDA